jgi:hypothetical protein
MGAPGKNFFKQRAAIATQAVVLKQQREGAATAGTAALDQIYASLRTTGNGASSILSADNNRRTAALQRIGSRSAGATARTVDQAQAGNVNRYGSAVGQLSSQQLKPAAAQAREAAGVGRATAKAGRSLATAGNQAMDILQAGNVSSRNSADYAMASALMYRAKDDASLIAQQRSDLAMQKAQFQHDEDMARLNYKLANADQAGGSSMQAVATSAGQSAAGMWDYFGWHHADGTPAVGEISLGEDGKPAKDATGKPVLPGMTGGLAAQTYIAEHGITDENEAQVIYAIANAMFSAGAGQAPGAYHPVGATQAIMDAVNARMALMYPNYAKHQGTINDLVNGLISGVGPTGGGDPGVPRRPNANPAQMKKLRALVEKFREFGVSDMELVGKLGVMGVSTDDVAELLGTRG